MFGLVPVSSDLSLLAVSRTTVPSSQWGRNFHMIWRCLVSFLAQRKAVATTEHKAPARKAEKGSLRDSCWAMPSSIAKDVWV